LHEQISYHSRALVAGLFGYAAVEIGRVLERPVAHSIKGPRA
jgi:hypothetical protein